MHVESTLRLQRATFSVLLFFLYRNTFICNWHQGRVVPLCIKFDMLSSIFFTLSTDAPFNTTIVTSRTNYYVGENADLKCISDGNPSPNYKWMFNFTEIINSSKYSISDDKSKLLFTLHITDNGNYQCVSSNEFGGNVINVMLTVQEKNVDPSSSDMKSTCSRTSCLFIQSCTLRNGSSICSLNIWSVISFVFIALTIISGAACVSLILSRKPRKKINQTNGIGWVYSDHFQVYRLNKGL